MNAPDKAVLALIKALRPAIRQVVRHDARQGRPPQRMPLARCQQARFHSAAQSPLTHLATTCVAFLVLLHGCRSQHDKVILACHAVHAINGLKLVAVGPQADAAGQLQQALPTQHLPGSFSLRFLE